MRLRNFLVMILFVAIGFASLRQSYPILSKLYYSMTVIAYSTLLLIYLSSHPKHRSVGHLGFVVLGSTYFIYSMPISEGPALYSNFFLSNVVYRIAEWKTIYDQGTNPSNRPFPPATFSRNVLNYSIIINCYISYCFAWIGSMIARKSRDRTVTI